jgi:hypothetical protein
MKFITINNERTITQMSIWYTTNDPWDHMSQDKLMTEIRENRDKINFICKHIGDISMCLYTSDMPVGADDYIENYRSLPQMYGPDPLNDFDVWVIRQFNM